MLIAIALLAQIFVGTGIPLGPSMPPTSWQEQFNPNPFNVPLCAIDPCTPPNVDPNSASEIAFVMTAAGGFTLGELNVRQPGQLNVGTDHQPVYYASNKDPLYTITCDGGAGQCAVLPVTINIPNGARASNATDHRFQVVEANGIEYAFQQFNDGGTGTGTTNPLFGGGTISVNGGGYVTSLGMYAARGGCTTCQGQSAGLPTQPTLLTANEIVQGNIAHPFAIALRCPSNQFRWPAVKSDGPHPQCDAGPPEGSYIWLNMTDSAITALGFCPWETTMLHAMHHYGLFITATAGAPGPWGFYALDDMSQMIWGGVGDWSNFWTWNSSSCPSANPAFAGGASHMLLQTAGILQTNLEIVYQ